MLLRSNRSNEVPTRVDVLFKGIMALKLPTSFDGLSITEVAYSEAIKLGIPVGCDEVTDRRIFVISGDDFVGYIVAANVFWHEDEGAYYDESYFKNSFSPADRELFP